MKTTRLRAPSRLGYLAWGAASLVPQAIVVGLDGPYVQPAVRFCVLPVALAAATYRATRSNSASIEVYLSLQAIFLLLWALVAAVVPLSDGEWPLMTRILPVPEFEVRLGGWLIPSVFRVYWITVGYMFVSAIFVRFILGGSFAKILNRSIWASTVFAVLFGIHVITAPRLWRTRLFVNASDLQIILSIYSVALSFGAFFVALLYDYSHAGQKKRCTAEFAARA